MTTRNTMRAYSIILVPLLIGFMLSGCSHMQSTGESFVGEVRWQEAAQEGDSLNIHVFHGMAPRGLDLAKPPGLAQEILLEPGSKSHSFELTLDNHFIGKCKQSEHCTVYVSRAGYHAQTSLQPKRLLLLDLQSISSTPTQHAQQE